LRSSYQGIRPLTPITAAAATGATVVVARTGGKTVLTSTAPATTAAGPGPRLVTSFPAVDGARLLTAVQRALHLASRAHGLAVGAMDVAGMGLACAGAGRDPAAESAVRENRPPNPRA